MPTPQELANAAFALADAAKPSAETSDREAVTQRLSMTTTSATATSAFVIGTRAVRLTATAACHYAIGANPTATTDDAYLPAATDRRVHVNPGDKIAAKTPTSTGVLFITELSRT